MLQKSGSSENRQDIIDAIQEDLRSDLEGLGNISKREIAAHIAGAVTDRSGDEIAEEILRSALFADVEEVSEPIHEPSAKQEAAEEIKNPVDAEAVVDVTPDLMNARILIKPPQNGGREITEDYILQKLREKNVIKGINFEYIYRLANYTVYNKRFKIAKGERPVNGTDAQIKYHISEAKEPAEFLNAADYAKIQYTKVSEGDLLCEVISATPGRNGWNILGKTLPAKDGKNVGDISGNNTVFADNKLYAACSGMVTVREGIVNVYSAVTYGELSNIRVEHEGMVFVDGNVTAGSEILAQGDIIVRGYVQNALLQSGGNIILCKGITGKNSVIKAKGNVRSYFVENAKVRAGGNLTADVIMRADVGCACDVRLSGGRENIIGGICRAGGDISARNIGNDINLQTEICLVGNLQLHTEKREALERISKYNKAIEQLQDMQKRLVDAETEVKRKILAIRYTYAKNRLKKEIEVQYALLEELDQKQEMEPGGKIDVRGRIYPNVTVNIDGVVHKIEHEHSYCSIAKRNNKIVLGMAGEREY